MRRDDANVSQRAVLSFAPKTSLAGLSTCCLAQWYQGHQGILSKKGRGTIVLWSAALPYAARGVSYSLPGPDRSADCRFSEAIVIPGAAPAIGPAVGSDEAPGAPSATSGPKRPLCLPPRPLPPARLPTVRRCERTELSAGSPPRPLPTGSSKRSSSPRASPRVLPVRLPTARALIRSSRDGTRSCVFVIVVRRRAWL